MLRKLAKAPGLVGAAADLGRVFVGDKAAREAQASANYSEVMAQFGAEFVRADRSGFDIVMDGINRVPRPLLTFATIGLFAYAMIDPIGFAVRMQGLTTVPDPLWYILGSIVAFYFGARELHYRRKMRAPSPEDVTETVAAIREIEALRPDPEPDKAAPRPNAALERWRTARAS
ncbi:MAG: holin family protein [Pseudomonadota bacterium]